MAFWVLYFPFYLLFIFNIKEIEEHWEGDVYCVFTAFILFQRRFYESEKLLQLGKVARASVTICEIHIQRTSKFKKISSYL